MKNSLRNYNFAKTLQALLRFVVHAFVSLFILGSANAFSEVFIEVFGDQTPTSIPRIPGAEIAVYDLSLVDMFKQNRPSFPHNNNPEQAERKAMAWYNSPAGQAYRESLIQATRPLQRMGQLRVTKVPAIVFNERYVVYGTLDIAQAWRDFNEHVQH